MSTARRPFPAGRLAAAGALILAAGVLLGLGGCVCGRQPAAPVAQPDLVALLAAERFSGDRQATPLFAPSQPASAEPGAAVQADLPPMAWFNVRTPWPAAAGYRLGEVTFYREWYVDRQSSYAGGGRTPGRVHDYVRRQFESYRTGVYTR